MDPAWVAVIGTLGGVVVGVDVDAKGIPWKPISADEKWHRLYWS